MPRPRREGHHPAPPPGASDIVGTYDLAGAPGHLIRRAQQVHVEIWGQLVDGGLTTRGEGQEPPPPVLRI
ncbi:MAG: hypothetical protein ACRDXE_07695, partial [Acidimicrobiales bacterium]